MWAELQCRPLTEAPATVPVTHVGAVEFAHVVARLRGSPEAQAAAERQRLANSALPGHFLVLREGDQPVASGCVIVDGDLAGIFNMLTAKAQRGRGHATALVGHLLQHAVAAGARVAYLQVDAANAPARRVYSRFGFRDRYAYWYRVAPGNEGERQ
jgi:predicted GNAT family acetyltransferase